MTAKNDSGLFFGSPDFERGRYGWAVIQQKDGSKELYKRATPVAGYLDDKQGLVLWKAAMTAQGLMKSDSLRASFSVLSWEDDKANVKQLVEKAASLGGGDRAAELGTAFHKVVEMHHLGQEIDMDALPAGFPAALEAYKKFLSDNNIEVAATEVRVVDDKHQIAGTADLVYRFADSVETPYGTIEAGTGIIADIKTGSVGEYSGLSMSTQLSIYSHGTPYDPMAGTRHDWPGKFNKDVGLILKVDLKTGAVVPWWLNLAEAAGYVEWALRVNEIRYAGKKLISQADLSAEKPKAPAKKAAPKKKAPAKKAEAPAPEPKEDDSDLLPFDEPEEVEEKPKSTADTIAAEAAAVDTIGEAKELYRKWKRSGAKAAELAIITDRAAELGATVRK